MRVKKTLKNLAKQGRLGIVAQIASGNLPGAIGNIFHDGHMDGVNDNDFDSRFNPPKKKKPPIRNFY